MADYGIVVGIESIKGNCQLEKYKDFVLAKALTFGSGASRVGVGTGALDNVSVNQSSVTVTMAGGKWAAEFLNACYHLTKLGTVNLVQLAQAVDKKATAEPRVIQTLKLEGAMVTAVSQAWGADAYERTIDVTFEFGRILLDIDKKPADFTLRNFMAKAV